MNYVDLINGVKMPKIGLGVYKMTKTNEAKNAVIQALNAGYKAIDTASFYENELEVGKAIPLRFLEKIYS